MDADILKILVWPGLILAIVVLLLLVPSTRASIGGLLGRVTKVGLSGVEAAQAQTSPSKPTTPAPSAGTPPDPVLEPLVQRYRAWLDANVREPAQREEVSLRHAARQEIWLGHEIRYRLIFGSQIRLVEAASNSGNMPIAEAKRLYDTGKASAPGLYAAGGSYSFEQWLQWVIQQGLVTADTSSVQATLLTRDFLFYVDQMRLPRAKPG